jgi:hypothetical protein
MWQAARDTVIKNFPKAPGLPKDKHAYLRNVDEICKSVLAALDRACIDGDVGPFTALIAQRVRWGLDKHELKFPDPRERYIFRPRRCPVLRTGRRNEGDVRYQRGISAG